MGQPERGFTLPLHLQQNACIAWTRYGPTSHDLIDTSPLSTANQSFDADREDCALPVGESWTDPTGFLRIKNLRAGGTAPFDYLDLQITYFTNQPLFELFTTTNLTMPGLVASFVNTSLRGYAAQNDWRRHAADLWQPYRYESFFSVEQLGPASVGGIDLRLRRQLG